MSENPRLGWGLAIVFFTAAAGVFAFQFLGSGPADSMARRSEDITLRCTETDTEWTMNRGQFERALMTYQGELTADGMFPSPYAEGRPVAILVDRSDWRETIERINKVRDAYAGKRRGSDG